MAISCEQICPRHAQLCSVWASLVLTTKRPGLLFKVTATPAQICHKLFVSWPSDGGGRGLGGHVGERKKINTVRGGCLQKKEESIFQRWEPNELHFGAE